MRWSIVSILVLCTLCSCHKDKRHLSIQHPHEDKQEEVTQISYPQSEEVASVSTEDGYKSDGYETVKVKDHLPEQVINRKSYVRSYNKDTRCANWVGWYLSAEHADGAVKRKGMDYLEDREF